MHVNDLLKIATERRASDLHLKVGSHPVLRINGHLTATKTARQSVSFFGGLRRPPTMPLTPATLPSKSSSAEALRPMSMPPTREATGVKCSMDTPFVRGRDKPCAGSLARTADLCYE